MLCFYTFLNPSVSVADFMSDRVSIKTLKVPNDTLVFSLCKHINVPDSIQYAVMYNCIHPLILS